MNQDLFLKVLRKTGIVVLTAIGCLLVFPLVWEVAVKGSNPVRDLWHCLVDVPKTPEPELADDPEEDDFHRFPAVATKLEATTCDSNLGKPVDANVYDHMNCAWELYQAREEERSKAVVSRILAAQKGFAVRSIGYWYADFGKYEHARVRGVDVCRIRPDPCTLMAQILIHRKEFAAADSFLKVAEDPIPRMQVCGTLSEWDLSRLRTARTVYLMRTGRVGAAMRNDNAHLGIVNKWLIRGLRASHTDSQIMAEFGAAEHRIWLDTTDSAGWITYPMDPDDKQVDDAAKLERHRRARGYTTLFGDTFEIPMPRYSDTMSDLVVRFRSELAKSPILEALRAEHPVRPERQIGSHLARWIRDHYGIYFSGSFWHR